MKLASKLAAALAVFFCCLHGFGQAAPISGQAVDQNGAPIPFAQVRVCSVTSTGTPCTPTATIYYDYHLQNVAPNPYQADQYGNYTVYAPALAAPNLYVVQLSPASGVTWTYVENGPSCSLSGCTFTGPITAPYYNATQSPYYEVNGVQIASTNLLDSANLARLNVANVFSLNQTAPTFTGALIGNANTATALAAVPTGCVSNLFATSIAANGNLGCSAITGTALPAPGTSTLGGVFSSTAPTNEFATGVNTSGNLTYAQPTYANLGGSVPTWNQNTTGNAATATALASTPTLCASGSYAGGILANGNATGCTSLGGTDAYTASTGCAFSSDGNGLTCSVGTVTFSPAMPDTGYTILCTPSYSNAIITVTSAMPSIGYGWTALSTTSFTLLEQLNNGSSTGWSIATNYGATIYCHIHHE